MNFYKHFIGDYQRDTMHLTMQQDGAYRRLLDACYATEKLLPPEKDACYRLARAFDKDERDAVDFVLGQFFPVGQDGHRHNKRSDLEIANASAYAAAQTMRAHKRWHKPTDNDPASPEDASHSHSHSHSPQPEAKAIARKGKSNAPQAALPDWLPAGAWDAFVEMRQKIRAPMTDRAKVLAIKTLDRLRARGESPEAVLEQSVERSWRGLFPIGGERSTRNQRAASAWLERR